MLKDEVFKILVLIESIYPLFTLKSKSVERWFNHSTDMDFEGVMKKLNCHIRKSPYPPALDEIIIYNDLNDLLINHSPSYKEASGSNWLKDYIVKL